MIQREILNLTLEDLKLSRENSVKGWPRICVSTNLVNGYLIAIKEGETGYWLLDGGRKPENGEVVKLNKMLNITPAECETFVLCSMFGWANYADTLEKITISGKYDIPAKYPARVFQSSHLREGFRYFYSHRWNVSGYGDSEEQARFNAVKGALNERRAIQLDKRNTLEAYNKSGPFWLNHIRAQKERITNGN